jgi:hypothetical protein
VTRVEKTGWLTEKVEILQERRVKWLTKCVLGFQTIGGSGTLDGDY